MKAIIAAAVAIAATSAPLYAQSQSELDQIDSLARSGPTSMPIPMRPATGTPPAAYAPTMAPSPYQTMQSAILRAGLPVPLITREELTTKKKRLRVGQRFQMEVAENVTQNGVLVIPAGTPAIGEVTEVRNKGMWGKSGYIGARVVAMNLAGRVVRLSGSFDDKGVTGTGGVIAAILISPITGFLVTGTSAFIGSGSGVRGYLDEDLAVQGLRPQMIQTPLVAPWPAR